MVIAQRGRRRRRKMYVRGNKISQGREGGINVFRGTENCYEQVK